MKNEYFIILNNEYFSIEFRKKYGIESLIVLGLIQLNKLLRGKYIFNLDYLYEKLNISSTNTLQKNKIKNCVYKLIKDKIIISDIEISKIKNNKLIVVDLEISENDYTIVYDDELDTILNSKDNIYNLFYLFSFIKYRINPNSKICYWSIQDFQKQMDISSNNTMLYYINVLENELKLIKKINPGNRLFKDGTIKQSNNIYTINDDNADDVLKRAKEKYKNELEENNVKLTKSKNANEKRRIKAKLNHLERKYKLGKINEIEYIQQKEKLEEEYNKLNISNIENSGIDNTNVCFDNLEANNSDNYVYVEYTEDDEPDLNSIEIDEDEEIVNGFNIAQEAFDRNNRENKVIHLDDYLKKIFDVHYINIKRWIKEQGYNDSDVIEILEEREQFYSDNLDKNFYNDIFNKKIEDRIEHFKDLINANMI